MILMATTNLERVEDRKRRRIVRSAEEKRWFAESALLCESGKAFAPVQKLVTRPEPVLTRFLKAFFVFGFIIKTHLVLQKNKNKNSFISFKNK